MVKESIFEGSRPITFTYPSRFIERIKEADMLLDNDENFWNAISGVDPRYQKRNKQNKLKSIKYRFLVVNYINQRKKALLDKDRKEKEQKIIQENKIQTEEVKKIEQNEQTWNSNQEKEDIQ